MESFINIIYITDDESSEEDIFTDDESSEDEDFIVFSYKSVTFCENIVTHLIEYEDRTNYNIVNQLRFRERILDIERKISYIFHSRHRQMMKILVNQSFMLLNKNGKQSDSHE
ncbi:113L [Cherax quadricarinatus iridovirus]|uniref:Uncharacterized protein n=1 Tax=Shrimp hemocyte iridescent virus TaxID=2039780 RepID=A0A291B0P0_9VIRU|nr:113L [Cherax quadricarinatus iridovirus]YP_010084793.1 hypothetical protein KM509_gp041 [Shrimp hemocyte iridescent virus]UPA43423.1 hypothetical protein 4TH000149 [Iridovirus CN01]ASZ85093.1 113L [Cherax quadricarinatus iridovirus]ATE87050.1 hypothetical protein [Shrimp hemocyte iridescent virus]UPA43499.1 hypothetical protein 3TG000066 [Iridovirus CN01]UPA43695.1 hypothetical protein 1DG000103 [Iridovirus CN01]